MKTLKIIVFSTIIFLIPALSHSECFNSNGPAPFFVSYCYDDNGTLNFYWEDRLISTSTYEKVEVELKGTLFLSPFGQQFLLVNGVPFPIITNPWRISEE